MLYYMAVKCGLTCWRRDIGYIYWDEDVKANIRVKEELGISSFVPFTYYGQGDKIPNIKVHRHLERIREGGSILKMLIGKPTWRRHLEKHWRRLEELSERVLKK